MAKIAFDGDCAWNTKLTITGLASRNSAKMMLLECVMQNLKKEKRRCFF